VLELVDCCNLFNVVYLGLLGHTCNYLGCWLLCRGFTVCDILSLWGGV